MGSKLSQYDYSILTLKCVNLIQEKTVTPVTAVTPHVDIFSCGLVYIDV